MSENKINIIRITDNSKSRKFKVSIQVQSEFPFLPITPLMDEMNKMLFKLTGMLESKKVKGKYD